MRVVVFGASGSTGRCVVEQALAAGHHVAAVTRRTNTIPPQDKLTVLHADASDVARVDAAIVGGDAVVSALGVSYTRKPVTVYSTGTANIIDAMHRHAVDRLAVVSSAAIDPAYQPSDSFAYTRVVEPFFMRRPGRTLYDDISRMEALVTGSDVSWTIIRSCWLYDAAHVSDFHVTYGTPSGMYTARSDLAANMLRALADDRTIHQVIAVHTATGTPGLVRQIWREGIMRKKTRE
jgi:putative NADH-flavin reductase